MEPDNGKQADPPRIGLRVILGLLQGLALHGLFDAAGDGRWPAADPILLSVLTAGLVTLPVAGQLLGASLRARGAGLFVGLLILMVLGFGWHHGATRLPDGPSAAVRTSGLPLFLFVLSVWGLMVLPFLQARLRAGRWRVAYADIAGAAWHNALVLAQAALFTGLFWGVLELWQQAFRLVGIDVFRRVFHDPLFAFPVTTATFSLAVGLTGAADRFSRVVLHQSLNLLKWLAVPVCLLLALFSLTLLADVQSLFVEGRSRVATVILLWLIAAVVFAVNAAFRDGTIVSPFPRAVGLAIRTVLPAMPVIAVLAGYALWLRIAAYGLTGDRVWALVVVAAAMAYAVGYAGAALRGLRSPRWMAGLATVNVVVAIGLVVVVAGAMTPLLSPDRLAAAAQTDRALREATRSSGAAVDASPGGNHPRAGRDPLAYLRFEAGRYGLDRLRMLSMRDDLPALRQAALDALARTSPAASDGPDQRLLEGLAVHPPGAPIEPALRKRLADDMVSSSWLFARSRRLFGLFADLDLDGIGEFVLISDTLPAPTLRLYRRQPSGDWVSDQRQMVLSREEGRRITIEAVLEGLQQGDFGPRPPAWQDLGIGPLRFRVP